ncbi:hypothetical protein AAG570_010610 [Ranatra chinensis]|uniref:Uncharacterized protein n=1 Tax=Ranatra chinensis TaxID=642074 RepID=A0ABD0Z549_9HEMI
MGETSNCSRYYCDLDMDPPPVGVHYEGVVERKRRLMAIINKKERHHQIVITRMMPTSQILFKISIKLVGDGPARKESTKTRRITLTRTKMRNQRVNTDWKKIREIWPKERKQETVKLPE